MAAEDVTTAAAINLLASILFLTVFSFARLQPQNARVYYPKWYMMGVKTSSVPSGKRLSLRRYLNLDFKAYLKLLSWVKQALRMSEQELIDHSGLDSAIYMRIFLLGLKIFLPIGGLGLVLLLPVNATDTNLETQGRTKEVAFDQIDKLSISNVVDKSPRLWTHLLMAYIFTAWTCVVLYSEFRTIAIMRLNFLASRKRAPNQFTVLVRQVPEVPERSLDQNVYEFFKTNHPDTYLTHNVVQNANKLAKILQEKKSMEQWLSYSQIKYDKHPSKRPTMRLGFWGLWGEKVDVIDYYVCEIDKLNQKRNQSSNMARCLNLDIVVNEFKQEELHTVQVKLCKAAAELEVVLCDRKAEMAAAFVSFKTRWGAAVCAQTQQNRNPTNWMADWAPEPRDVYWRNLAIPFVSLTARKVLINGALFALILTCMIPILAIQSLANLEGIEKKAKFLRPIIEQKFVRSVLQGFLPGFALRLFLLLVPHLLMVMSKFEGFISYSTLDTKSAGKLYYILVINVFFGSVITGSLVEQVNSILSHSSVTDILQTFGNAIPTKATFYITYIMADGWSGVSLELLRVFPLIIYHIKNMLFVTTKKDRDLATAPGDAMFNVALPHLELYFLLGIVYSVITPIIMPFIIFFFAFGYLVYRNQVINVYDPRYDSAGAFWPHIHGRIITAMIIEQLMLIGIFTIKGPIGFVKDDDLTGSAHKVLHYIRQILSSTPFMITLPVLTLIFHYYCRNRFETAFLKYPLEEAMAKDIKERKATPNLKLSVYLKNAYTNPALKQDDDDDELISSRDGSKHDGSQNGCHQGGDDDLEDHWVDVEQQPIEHVEWTKNSPSKQIVPSEDESPVCFYESRGGLQGSIGGESPHSFHDPKSSFSSAVSSPGREFGR